MNYQVVIYGLLGSFGSFKTETTQTYPAAMESMKALASKLPAFTSVDLRNMDEQTLAVVYKKEDGTLHVQERTCSRCNGKLPSHPMYIGTDKGVCKCST